MAVDIEHPINVKWVDGYAVISNENKSIDITIDNVALLLNISAVVEDGSTYIIAYHCTATKFDANAEVIGLYAGEVDIVTISKAQLSKIDCGFGIVLELSLANKAISAVKE
ncbi:MULTISPECIES: hypothetical protein [Pseudoalteromonas]|uniref:Uncharacterized protein n=1 Tax=Pseudoalteromonas luteoviolacea (strain 2ta16) TaxID=1353533 RepID=V4J8A8_PSEL2|nr:MULTISPECIES: hypothetical protein [Pseudoalteromonas]ESP91477.1 hypothetical protein PL2TA16_00276 [Pseudoalteromonas luteoviolacea 2ta16]KZN40126.1 hypothetical protein N483_18225 [Pseudoalteromonas luteoviolacea NCIMB 1944]MCG7551185.1 hypothetical protein [Pseudoalteromonas sp. Of7M-16]